MLVEKIDKYYKVIISSEINGDRYRNVKVENLDKIIVGDGELLGLDYLGSFKGRWLGKNEPNSHIFITEDKNKAYKLASNFKKYYQDCIIVVKPNTKYSIISGDVESGTLVGKNWIIYQLEQGDFIGD